MRSKETIEYAIEIDASPEKVWQALTEPPLMAQWMAEPEINLQVTVDWKIGGSMETRGFHHLEFVNKGRVIRFEPPRCVAYTALSSLSGLNDREENHTVIDFQLIDLVKRTHLNISIYNFPTEVIFRHFDFYWKNTLPCLKEFVEDHDFSVFSKPA